MTPPLIVWGIDESQMSSGCFERPQRNSSTCEIRASLLELTDDNVGVDRFISFGRTGDRFQPLGTPINSPEDLSWLQSHPNVPEILATLRHVEILIHSAIETYGVDREYFRLEGGTDPLHVFLMIAKDIIQGGGSLRSDMVQFSLNHLRYGLPQGMTFSNVSQMLENLCQGEARLAPQSCQRAQQISQTIRNELANMEQERREGVRAARIRQTLRENGSTFGTEYRTGNFLQLFNVSLGPAFRIGGDPSFAIGTEWGWSHLPTGIGLNVFYHHLADSGSTENPHLGELSLAGVRPHYTIFNNPDFPNNQYSRFNYGIRFGLPMGVQIPHEDTSQTDFSMGGSLEFLLNSAYPNDYTALGTVHQLLGIGLNYHVNPLGDPPIHTFLATFSINGLSPVYLVVHAFKSEDLP